MIFQKTPMRVQFPLLSFPIIHQFQNKYFRNLNLWPSFLGNVTKEKAGDEVGSWIGGL